MTAATIATCGCGMDYAPTLDGRQRHQMIYGHRPTMAVEPTQDPATDADGSDA